MFKFGYFILIGNKTEKVRFLRAAVVKGGNIQTPCSRQFMNIFFLDEDPVLAAQYHCDKHVVKMILESAQLLSTAHRVLDGELGIRLSASGARLKDYVLPDAKQDLLYKATHISGPCAVWAREASDNYEWLFGLFIALGDEYSYRYNKEHLSISKLERILAVLPKNIPTKPLTKPPLVMPEGCKDPDPILAYRKYYKTHKSEIAKWTKRSTPDWYK